MSTTDNTLDKAKINALANEFAKDIKTEHDLSNFTQALTKAMMEAVMGVEMDQHLGYKKNAPEGIGSGNSRNGKSKKTIKGSHGEVEIEVPRDRNGTFEPILLPKHRRRFSAFDDQILCLYAKGMTTRDIAATFHEMYGAEVSHTLISQVTEAVSELVTEWQSRPLDAVYPILYLDCLVVKVHHEKRVIKKSVYLALAVNMEGHKELLGMWISETEGAKFWMSVLNEIRNRGVKDIFIVCTDGLTGFADAIEAVFPKAITQTCIVHLIRNSLKYVSYKDRKAVAKDLKSIYQASTIEEAQLALEQVADTWDEKYASVSRLWRSQWDRVVPFLEFPPEIRKVIYTTNAIESLNSVIRKSIKLRKIFPNDDSVFRTLFLAIQKASERWTMPIQHWAMALNQFSIAFGDRMED